MAWRLRQTPYNLLAAHGPASASSGNASVGVQSYLFHDALRHSSPLYLGNHGAWHAVCQTLTRLDKWNTYCTLVMPDHIHLLTAPSERELSVSAFLKCFKRWFNEMYNFPNQCRWQPGGFDRLLRTSESIREKWLYIRENPVRAGLVTHWKQWPYRAGFFDDEV
jgi:REP element-mobilizing transposase RayT